ncbi:DoxX family protein [Candidatus Marinarcus aquaticus]|uniref:GntR family transcriptional regulator n=1 Tax=Candidatus Marinarcus aquaticus TaxID=2044504 RepID=A0A4Q0XUI3_9BACT|nr:DoxX family protein [Candidatus Marinarcus aquaticus]RXJ60595.1 GntR family transcriptional regulator [Candidatus Marinarcus aquaticus]
MTTNSDIGKLLLRILLGALMLFHGIAKVNHGIAFIMGRITQAGLPEFLAYGVYVGEIIAPILLILGLKTRFAAFIVAVTMLFAIYLVHANDLLTLTQTGAWAIELQMFYLGTAIVIMFMGAGRISWDKE